jgi:hypothetical protein
MWATFCLGGSASRRQREYHLHGASMQVTRTGMAACTSPSLASSSPSPRSQQQVAFVRLGGVVRLLNQTLELPGPPLCSAACACVPAVRARARACLASAASGCVGMHPLGRCNQALDEEAR